MGYRPRIHFVAVFACLGLILSLAACEDLNNFAITSINGSVTDPTGRGLSGVRVGVIYQMTTVSAPGVRTTAAGPEPGGTAAEAVRLLNPYPNPARAPIGDVRIRWAADADTTALVEVWTEVGGVSTLVAGLHSGAVSEGLNEAIWDGRDDFDLLPVPNGLYTVRLTVPTSGDAATVTEAPILINRTAREMQDLDTAFEGVGFNGLSAPDGSFLVTDIAVGVTFPVTSTDSPDPISTGLTRNQVSLVFLDPDYFDNGREVVIGAGDVVSMAPVALTPKFPAAAAGPANAPAP